MTTRNTRATGTSAILAAAALAAACNGTKTAPDGAAAEQDPATMTREERIEFRRKLLQEKAVARLEEEPSTPVTGEVPKALLDAVFADLEDRSGQARKTFTVLRGEAVQWNDGSLGCARPDEVYTQMLVDGYRIVIEVVGDAYDYRADGRGNFRLCTEPGSLTRRLPDIKKGPREGAPVE